MNRVKKQFPGWLESFVCRVEAGNFIIRIFYRDVLSVGHILQHRNRNAQEVSPNLYRYPYRADALHLASNGPATYHMINTSNLADSLGPINVLSACASLLDRLPVSSLYLETLVKKEENLQNMGRELLGGDIVTVAQFFAFFLI